MTILLDSANLDDIGRAATLGYVRGITTNPTLMRRETKDPLRHAERILAAIDGVDLYYQPTGAYGAIREEVDQAVKLAPQRIVVKLPATPDGAALAGAMVRQGVRVAFTAVQSAQAMIVAEAIGCIAVIPYVDRASRDIRIGSHLVAALAEHRRRRETQIVAASIKTVGQFVDAFRDGADAVTAPRAVLDELLSHPATLEADRQFADEYRKA